MGRAQHETSRGDGAPPERVARELVLTALERHERSLLALATRLLRDGERARDVVQEVFLRLVRTPRAEVEDHLAAWLHTVCRNLALDVRRKEGRMSELVEPSAAERVDEDAAPDARIERAEAAASVLDQLERLPERQREALTLKFHSNLSYRQIAEVMQTSTGNVGWLLHEGIKALRGRLSGLLAFEGMERPIGEVTR